MNRNVMIRKRKCSGTKWNDTTKWKRNTAVNNKLKIKLMTLCSLCMSDFFTRSLIFFPCPSLRAGPYHFIYLYLLLEASVQWMVVCPFAFRIIYWLWMVLWSFHLSLNYFIHFICAVIHNELSMRNNNEYTSIDWLNTDFFLQRSPLMTERKEIGMQAA